MQNEVWFHIPPEARTFLQSHPLVFDALIRDERNPAHKAELVHRLDPREWPDEMVIWLLELCGEEDTMIDIILGELGWSNDRVAAALERADWSAERIAASFFLGLQD